MIKVQASTAAAIIFGIAGAGLVGFPSEAIASSVSILPAASYESDVFYGNSATPPFDINVSHTIHTPGLLTIDNGGFSEISVLPNPTITARAFGNVLGPYLGYYGTSGSTIHYFAEIVGPTAYIPIDYNFSGTSSQSGPDGANNIVYISLGTGGFGVGGTVFRSDLDHSPTFSGKISTATNAGAIFGITVNAVTYAAEGFGNSGYIHLDPILSIDPSFAAVDPNYLSDYSILTSTGVGNQPDVVPEPLTWALMICGFGLAGTTLRRRRAMATWVLTR